MAKRARVDGKIESFFVTHKKPRESPTATKIIDLGMFFISRQPALFPAISPSQNRLKSLQIIDTKIKI
jgi:hypothetical protein